MNVRISRNMHLFHTSLKYKQRLFTVINKYKNTMKIKSPFKLVFYFIENI